MLEPWVLAAVALVVLLGAVEGGFRLGRWRSRRGGVDRTQITTVQAAILGFLGLLLAFSFSLSQARFDTRRRLVIEEANAIETTDLRARLLPPPLRDRARELLRDYAGSRIPAYDAEAVSRAIARSERMQQELWGVAQAVADEADDVAVKLLFTESLNQLIDLHTMRVAAYLYRAPPGLLLLLHVCAILALLVSGYATGIEGDRNLLVMMALALLVAVVLGLLSDLDEPRRGMLRTSQEPLLKVQESLGAERDLGR